MQPPRTNQDEAIGKAIARSRAQLRPVDLVARCRNLSLPEMQANLLPLRMFGDDLLFDCASLALKSATTGRAAKPADLLVFLHFLLCDLPVRQTGELVTFRDFPGGQFYYQPFLSRSSKILLGRFGNDGETLRKNLRRFDATPIPDGDLGALIHAFGPLQVALLYRLGDDEFPASADILFDAAVKRALGTEDAAAIATRVCLGLL